MLLFKREGIREKGIRERALCFFFTLLPLLFSLCSCGFAPMYAQTSDNAEIQSKLAAVEIKPIKTIIGQQYVNALEDVLNPGRSRASKDYVIEATITKDTQPLAIEQNRTVTRYKVMVVATYNLKEIISGKVITSSVVKGQGDYDKVDSDYATYVSEDETTSRVIRELAQDTKIRIIAALLK